MTSQTYRRARGSRGTPRGETRAEMFLRDVRTPGAVNDASDAPSASLTSIYLVAVSVLAIKIPVLVLVLLARSNQTNRPLSASPSLPNTLFTLTLTALASSTVSGVRALTIKSTVEISLLVLNAIRKVNFNRFPRTGRHF